VAGSALLEREHELAALTAAVDGARQGRGTVVLVDAPAGLGKTSLLRAGVEAAAEAAVTVLRARASELEHDFAYGCVRQLLEPVVTRATEPVRARLFAGTAARAQPLFAPHPQAGGDAFSMLHGLYWLLANLADDRPVVLAVDDLHWADPESLRFLNYLAPRLDGLAVAVLATVRSGDPGAQDPDVVRLAAGPETTVLRPGPLGLESAAALCEQRLGGGVAPDFAAACRDATGGNPLFLEELLREARARHLAPDAAEAARVRAIGPATVAQAVLLRLSGAPPATGALVRAVAVLGDGAALPEAAALAGVPEPEARQAADLLATLDVLKPGEPLEFVHPIVREAVYGDLGPRARHDAHGRAAEVLTAAGASEERIAAQLVAAEPAGDAERVALLRRVAGDALGRGAPAAAVAALRRALAEPPPEGQRTAVLIELGTAELRVAAPGAAGHLAEAVARRPEPAQLAVAVRHLANALTWARDSDRGVAALDAAIAEIAPVDRELALHLEAELAAHAQEADRRARAPAAGRLEQHRALPGVTRGERLVLAALAFEDARRSRSERAAVAAIERALAGGRLIAEQGLEVAPTVYVLLVGLLATDALDHADAVLDQMLADARAHVSIPATAFVLAHRGVAAMRRGSVAVAEADARTSLELLTAHGIPLGVDVALSVLVRALVETGDLDGAERALRDVRPGDIPEGLPTNALVEARGRLHLAQGRAADAVDDLVEFGRRDELWGGAHPLASRWRSLAALARAASGETGAARALARDDLDRAREWGAPSGVGTALRAVALTDAGRGADPVELLQEAAAVLAASPDRLEQARVLVDLGAALRRANRRSDARRALQEGLALAQPLGALALVERARTELRQAGGRSPGPAAVDALTASELRVAELAAEGLSNPEIAQALFVTRKTVETHLGAVYRKLGITGRVRLARALAARAAS
jgi:DNA-binding CsgD family transcriptional regulator